MSGLEKPFFIDDEADQASQNDKKNRKNETNTAINKCIINILKSIDYEYYFAITATLYINLMLNNDFLKLEKCFILKPGNNYVGLDYFLEEEKNEFRNDIIEIVDQDEIDKFHDKFTFGKAFYNAVLKYLFYAIFYLYKFKIPAQMFINPGIIKYFHDLAEEEVYRIVKLIINDINNENEKTSKLINRIIDNFNVYSCEKFQYNDVVDRVLEKLILKDNNELDIFVKKINMKERLPPYPEKTFNFLIGNSKLARGITIENLISTFIIHRAKNFGNMDTISQGARFLGYRGEFKFFLNLSISKDLFDDFDDIYKKNKLLYNKLIKIEEKNKFIPDSIMNPILVFNRTKCNFGPTGRNRVNQKTNIINQFESRKWLTNDIYSFSTDVINNSFNEKFTNKVKEIFIANKDDHISDFQKMYPEIKKNGNFSCLVYENLNEIFNNFKIDEQDLITHLDFKNERISRQIINENSNKKTIIVWMSLLRKNIGINNKFDYFRKRRLSNDNKITIEVGENDEYVGDKYWFSKIKDDCFFIQIYPIQIKEREELKFYKIIKIKMINKLT